MKQTEVVTQIDSSINKSSTAVQDHIEEVALSEAALAEAEEIVRVRAQAGNVSPWVRFQHWVADQYSELGGPPMSSQERRQAELSRAAHERQNGTMMILW